jgi:hypothetical protein
MVNGILDDTSTLVKMSSLQEVKENMLIVWRWVPASSYVSMSSCSVGEVLTYPPYRIERKMSKILAVICTNIMG